MSEDEKIISKLTISDDYHVHTFGKCGDNKIDKHSIYESKRNNRFLVNLPKEIDIEPWVITGVSKPKLFNGQWGHIHMYFVDPIGPSTSQRLFILINDIKEKNYKFNFTIESLDPTGVVVEEWFIDVEEVDEIDFGNLDMQDDNIQRIKMIIKPSNCVLKY